MKRIIFTLLLTVFIIAGFNNKAEAQCKQQMVYACATKGNTIYLRDFNTKLKKGSAPSARWTVVLNKDAKYRFYLCTPQGMEDKIILTLYDSKHPEKTNPYGSTYDPKTKKHRDHFDFVCKKSGMYYVSIRLKEDADVRKTCAVGILSFVGSSNK